MFPYSKLETSSTLLLSMYVQQPYKSESMKETFHKRRFQHMTDYILLTCSYV